MSASGSTHHTCYNCERGIRNVQIIVDREQWEKIKLILAECHKR